MSAHAGFVCEGYRPGDPTVASVLLGAGYQVACHLGKSDKCMAVRKSFGSIAQCADPDFCLEGLDGARIEDCGGGARVTIGDAFTGSCYAPGTGGTDDAYANVYFDHKPMVCDIGEL